MVATHWSNINQIGWFPWKWMKKQTKSATPWVVPPSKSHHQDYYIFSRESQPKPWFPLLLGRGLGVVPQATPKHFLTFIGPSKTTTTSSSSIVRSPVCNISNETRHQEFPKRRRNQTPLNLHTHSFKHQKSWERHWSAIDPNLGAPCKTLIR